MDRNCSQRGVTYLPQRRGVQYLEYEYAYVSNKRGRYGIEAEEA